MNKAYFLKRVREILFSGKLSKTQVDGITRILDYRDSHWPLLTYENWNYTEGEPLWAYGAEHMPEGAITLLPLPLSIKHNGITMEKDSSSPSTFSRRFNGERQ